MPSCRRQRPRPEQIRCAQRQRSCRRQRRHHARCSGEKAKHRRLPPVKQHQPQIQHRMDKEHDDHRALQNHVARHALRNIAAQIADQHQRSRARPQQGRGDIRLPHAACNGLIAAFHRCGKPQKAERSRCDRQAGSPAAKHPRRGIHPALRRHHAYAKQRHQHHHERRYKADRPSPFFKARHPYRLLLEKFPDFLNLPAASFRRLFHRPVGGILVLDIAEHRKDLPFRCAAVKVPPPAERCRAIPYFPRLCRLGHAVAEPVDHPLKKLVDQRALLLSSAFIPAEKLV